MNPRYHIFALLDVRLMISGRKAAQRRQQAHAQIETLKQIEKELHSQCVVFAVLSAATGVASVQYRLHI